MIQIRNAMQKEVITFNGADKISEASKILRDHKISGAPVVDEGNKVIGILSEGDIIRLLEVHSPNLNLILPAPFDLIELPVRMKYEFDEIAAGINKAAVEKVQSIMTKQVKTITPEKSISDAAELMEKHNINRLPVVDEEDKLLGIITRGDIIGAMVKSDE